MPGYSKDFIRRIIIQALYNFFCKINNGFSNFVDSAHWAQTTVDCREIWGNYIFKPGFRLKPSPKCPSIMPDLNKIFWGASSEIVSFEIILNIYQRSSVFNKNTT